MASQWHQIKHFALFKNAQKTNNQQFIYLVFIRVGI